MFHVKHIPVETSNVSRETYLQVRSLIENNKNRLDEYVNQLLFWNKKVNLISRELSNVEILKHVEHSCYIASSQIFKTAELVIDAGTGGGLPGVPLAICFPDKKVIFVDIVEKKCMALRDICRQLNLKNVEIQNLDISFNQIKSPFIYISKHAFKLSDFSKMTKSQPWEAAIFLKGSDYITELGQVIDTWNVCAIDLHTDLQDPFYTDKFLLEITRQ